MHPSMCHQHAYAVHMADVEIRDLMQSLSEYLDRAERGELAGARLVSPTIDGGPATS